MDQRKREKEKLKDLAKYIPVLDKVIEKLVKKNTPLTAKELRNFREIRITIIQANPFNYSLNILNGIEKVLKNLAVVKEEPNESVKEEPFSELLSPQSPVLETEESKKDIKINNRSNSIKKEVCEINLNEDLDGFNLNGFNGGLNSLKEEIKNEVKPDPEENIRPKFELPKNDIPHKSHAEYHHSRSSNSSSRYYCLNDAIHDHRDSDAIRDNRHSDAVRDHRHIDSNVGNAVSFKSESSLSPSYLHRHSDAIRDHRHSDAIRDHHLSDAIRDHHLGDAIRDHRHSDSSAGNAVSFKSESSLSPSYLHRHSDAIHDRRHSDAILDNRHSDAIRDHRHGSDSSAGNAVSFKSESSLSPSYHHRHSDSRLDHHHSSSHENPLSACHDRRHSSHDHAYSDDNRLSNRYASTSSLNYVYPQSDCNSNFYSMPSNYFYQQSNVNNITPLLMENKIPSLMENMMFKPEDPFYGSDNYSFNLLNPQLQNGGHVDYQMAPSFVNNYLCAYCRFSSETELEMQTHLSQSHPSRPPDMYVHKSAKNQVSQGSQNLSSLQGSQGSSGILAANKPTAPVKELYEFCKKRRLRYTYEWEPVKSGPNQQFFQCRAKIVDLNLEGPLGGIKITERGARNSAADLILKILMEREKKQQNRAPERSDPDLKADNPIGVLQKEAVQHAPDKRTENAIRNPPEDQSTINVEELMENNFSHLKVENVTSLSQEITANPALENHQGLQFSENPENNYEAASSEYNFKFKNESFHENVVIKEEAHFEETDYHFSENDFHVPPETDDKTETETQENVDSQGAGESKHKQQQRSTNDHFYKIKIEPKDDTSEESNEENVNNTDSELSGKRLFICGLKGCGYSCETHDDLNEHLLVCDFSRNSSVLICPHCKLEIRRNGSFLKHLQLHGKQNYSCSLCDFISGQEKGVVIHCKSKHKVKKTRTIRKKAGSNEYFVIVPEEGEKPINTTEESKTTPKPKKAKLASKPKPASKPNPKFKYQCECCLKFQCPTYKGIMEHLSKTHNTKSQYLCTICRTYRSNSKQSFSKHFTSKHKGKEISAARCFSKIDSEGNVVEPDTLPFQKRKAGASGDSDGNKAKKIKKDNSSPISTKSQKSSPSSSDFFSSAHKKKSIVITKKGEDLIKKSFNVSDDMKKMFSQICKVCGENIEEGSESEKQHENCLKRIVKEEKMSGTESEGSDD